jgi:hypothetical protein
VAADGFGEGFTGFALVVVVVPVGVFVVVVGAAVVVVAGVVLAGVVVDVVLAARGVCAAPAQALSARQAAANQTVCRMVTEGNPARLPRVASPARPAVRRGHAGNPRRVDLDPRGR